MPHIRADDFRVMMVFVRMTSVIIFFLFEGSLEAYLPLHHEMSFVKVYIIFNILLGHPFSYCLMRVAIPAYCPSLSFISVPWFLELSPV